jgi:hypothetical protein
MSPKRRKQVAVVSLLAAGVMLWLERHAIAQGSGESWFWIVVAALVVMLAIAELAGVGNKPGEGSDKK